MPAMTKRVNVRTVVAVRTVNQPISGTYSNIIMSTSDILKCLCRRAVVDEILPNGKTVRLNMRNYYLDNGAGLDAYHPTKTENSANDEKKQEGLINSGTNNSDVKFNANIVPPPEGMEKSEESEKQDETHDTIKEQKPEVGTETETKTTESESHDSDKALSDPEASKDEPKETVVETTSIESTENAEEKQTGDESEGSELKDAAEQDASKETHNNSSKKNKNKK